LGVRVGRTRFLEDKREFRKLKRVSPLTSPRLLIGY
jgi:hypothetical protein